jgi:hypothetical protein
MITEPTVFILGAGASKPYGYPTGAELRRFICNNFISYLAKSSFSDHPQVDPQKRSKYETKAQELTETFRSSSNPSIDIFLSRNKQYSYIGKMAIACGIFHEEKDNKEKFREKVDANVDWYTYLYHRMTETLIEHDDFKNFSKNKINFITFNYDRSLEHFFYESFTNTFTQIPYDTFSVDELLPFEILHIFGQLVQLPWQDKGGIEYGYSGKVNLEELCDNIKIIYEKNDNPDILKTVKSLLSNAKQIFFLGFGYHNENLNILNIPDVFREGQTIYGTALNSTAKQKKDIITKLIPDRTKSRNFKEIEKGIQVKNDIKVRIEDKNCRELLEDYL